MTVPGQRAAQRPLRAMTAVQRVLGRAARAGDGGLVGPIGVAFIGGKQYQVDLSAPPGAQLSPLGPDVQGDSTTTTEGQG
ncbi:hypothetical protein [Actinacidiphila sp. ITFR-21]|uniref:hypothetical protein n=1 Tax=Actinacidiphila sp. ITFR-21 TaxID=3075199 RepID=UPI00288A4B4A|nr:hypothetical protein [Streptomyces sp. ITFR-21]WNI20291.1 hypothetical protein RLT57_33020 [Streptomyces sp. ITFR-21]